MYRVAIASWNIRGFNSLVKREAIKKFIDTNKIAIVGVLETRIRHTNESMLHSWFGRRWQLISNVGYGRNIRIVVMWDPSLVDVVGLWIDD